MKEMDALLKKLDAAVLSGLPYVMYRLTGESRLEAWVQKDQRLDTLRDFRESGFVMAPFDLGKPTVIFKEENVDRIRMDLDWDRVSHEKTIPSGKGTSPRKDEKRHLDLVSKGIEAIKNGEVLKIVLSRAEYLGLTGLDPVHIFLRLGEKYPDAFVYVWFHPDVGLWAGASPETLVRSSGNTFRTMALAGTQRFEGSTEVSWGKKERDEQQIVTDHIADTLSDYSLKIGPTHTKKAGELLHLCSEIQGELKPGESLGNLVEKLHPTPAVCGFPKIDALDFIRNEEGYDREFYTGYIGELNCADVQDKIHAGEPGNFRRSNLFVNLRCVQLFSQPEPGALIYVGGGITGQSVPEAEWRETVDKSMIMKSVLS